MDLGLRGKLVLITGASKGIGAAAAEVFAKEGCDLRLAARNAEDLRILADELAGRHGVTCFVHQTDLRNASQLARVAEEASDIDVLVNNAGDIPMGALGDIDETSWRHAWELKVFGYINLTRLVYPSMKRRGGGAIVNVIGAAGERSMPNYICGSAGNAALMAFTRSLGSASLGDNIRVVGINPGPVATDRLVSEMRRAGGERGDQDSPRSALKALPAGRAADPREIADTMAFLASSRSSYTSGVIVTINGGGGLPG